MSPTRRPSTVDGLRRATAPPPGEQHGHDTAGIGVQALTSPGRARPARVTLNLPPELYRQLSRWTDSAAETIDVPRVGVQEALRAMVRIITGDEAPSCSARVVAELRAELGH